MDYRVRMFKSDIVGNPSINTTRLSMNMAMIQTSCFSQAFQCLGQCYRIRQRLVRDQGCFKLGEKSIKIS